jgi:hypothetical protein
LCDLGAFERKVPIAHADRYAVDEDGALTASGTQGVLANDTPSEEGDTLTAALDSGPTHAASFQLNADGSFTYTPAANFNGTDIFSYHVNNGSGDSNQALATITVNPTNDAPTCGPATVTINEDMTGLTAPRCSDVDGDPLTYSIVSQGTNGSASVVNGQLRYQPNANINGADSFTYTASDGRLTANAASVNVTINPVNDAPTARGDSYSVNEDEMLSVAAPAVLGNDTDIDSASLTAVLVSGPIHGTLTLNTDGSFTYTPTPNYFGPDSFTYQANDGSLAAAATVNLAVVALSPTQEVTRLETQVKTLVNSGVLNGAQGQGLLSKLSTAKDALRNNKKGTACSTLQAFINQVTDLRANGVLTPAQAQVLITGATNLRTEVGC